MPTLLRSNAAAGVAMGLDSHLKELDRNEVQRQFDMGRHDKARAQQAGYLQALLANPYAAMTMVQDGKGGTMALGNLANDVHAANLRESTSDRWYDTDGAGKVKPKHSTKINVQDKLFGTNEGSRYKSKRIIEGE